MRSLTILTVLLTLTIFLPLSIQGQTPFVRVRFEVDGKDQPKADYMILVNADGQLVQARVLDESFVVPPEINRSSKIEVRFKVGDYDLFFSDLTKEHFDSEWLIGVTNPPFKEAPDLPLIKEGKTLRFVYYIEFHPKTGEGTGRVIPVYK